ncbi:MAG: DUF2779 domain-containing protein [Planctomycetota bacterium]
MPDCSEHHEFVAESGQDCGRELAAALIASRSDADAVVAYNSGFEHSCVRMIAEAEEPAIERHSSLPNHRSHHQPRTGRAEAEAERGAQREARLAELRHVALG